MQKTRGRPEKFKLSGLIPIGHGYHYSDLNSGAEKKQKMTPFGLRDFTYTHTHIRIDAASAHLRVGLRFPGKLSALFPPPLFSLTASGG
jgi:hypothetical protein